MTRPRPAAALLGCGAALAAAAAVNLVLLAAAGDALVFPGEMSALHVAGSTVAATPFAAVALALFPRRFTLLSLGVAIGTIPFAVAEFGAVAGAWLGAMHVVAGATAALVAPSVAGRFPVSMST